MVHFFKNIPLSHKYYYAFFFVLTFIFYGNSLRNKYALDDNFVTVTSHNAKDRSEIRGSVVAKGIKKIVKIWRSPYVKSKENVYEYRPIVSTTFAIEFILLGQNPFVNHLINVLLYFLTVCVVFSAVMHLLPNKEGNLIMAFLCSLFFLIHPIHSEAVDNLKSRDELLSLLFAMLSLIYGLKSYDTKKVKYILLAFLFLMISLLSKRNSTVFIFLIPLAIVFTRQLSLKNSFFLILPFAAFTAFNFFHMYMVDERQFRSCYTYENPLFTYPVKDFMGNMMIALKSYGFYIKSMVYPYPMCFYYGTNAFDISPNLNIYSLFPFLFGLVTLIIFYKTKDKLALFILLFFSIAISPFVNLKQPVAGIIGDRLSYQASFAFCLLLAMVFKRFFYLKDANKPKINLDVIKHNKSLIVLIVVCCVYVFNRNINWYNGLTLYEHDIKYVSNSAIPNNILASEYYSLLLENRNQPQAQMYLDKAFFYFKEALRNDSSIFVAAVNVGAIEHLYYGNYNKAIYFYRLSIKHKPTNSISYENLANTYFTLHQIDSAAANYKKSLQFNPKAKNSILGLKQCFLEQEMDREFEF